MKNVCTVLLNYNGTSDTIECIRSIEDLILIDVCLKVIIVDNNSSEDEYGELKSYLFENYNASDGKSMHDSKYVLLRNEMNIGFAAGSNKAIRFAEEHYNIDYYLLLNNDTVLNNDSLEMLLQAFSGPNVGAASGLIIDYSSKSKIWYAGGNISKLRSKGIHKYYGFDQDKVKLEASITNFLSGCYVIFKREALLNIQLLNERYFFGTEEYDFSIKLKKLGYDLMFIPSSIIYHKVKISEGNGSSHNIKDLIYVYNSMRNKHIFSWCNSNSFSVILRRILLIIYIKYFLPKKLLLNNQGVELKKEKIDELYRCFMKNLNKKFIDNKEFNEVQRKLM